MKKETWRQKLKTAFNKKSLAVFFNKFGFYLILLVCLGIIGITAALTKGGEEGLVKGQDQPEPSFGIDISITDVTEPDTEGIIGSSDGKTGEEKPNAAETGSTNPVNEKTDNKNPEDKKTGKETKTASEAPAEKTGSNANVKTEGETGKEPAGKPAGKSEEDEAVPVSQADSSSAEMIMPVNGDIVKPFTIDTLVYSPTLKEWTTHTGIDISGNVGDEVRAALSGVVESVMEDPLYGIVIVLAHGEDLKTVYTGLSTKEMVRIGQKVEKGQVISGIGRTAAFEITEDPHLHFEVLYKDEFVDPVGYIKEYEF
jgi:murein DD-endopeptidase MepM/ murein hydrolase activator NlpD